MGKRPIVRRRGRGGIFSAPTHRRVESVSYPGLTEAQDGKAVTAVVTELLHESGRGAPLARMSLEKGKEFYVPAPEGLSLNRKISIGESTVEVGNILPLRSIPEGTIVCNIERRPGEGAAIARSSGAYATLVSHSPRGAELKLPSMKSIYLDEKCRAMIGVVAGGGRTEKPFLKAGLKMTFMRARGRRWPRVKGTSMIAASHPHGGGRHRHEGKPTTVSRNAPPGRKVGLIAARQTGRASKSRGIRRESS
ncbi:50S ribosomal protein L2 [Candidatus Bathyarchaeota archaeon]|nr:50S ribosomal protein L2 [Candidatus Bathyarchaeota archaeon]